VYTPKHLAEKILTSKSALEGERKQVTVLFGDLKGSMELLADRDPEEGRKILDAVVERMMEAVHRYEGTVNQVMGDGIMALFGAPVAHEDHAARACYAALRMQEAVKRYADEARQVHGVTIQIRVGLNSGEVVVSAIGNDLRMDYTAVGQTTHLAARMEQLAAPGTIVVTPSTLELVEGLVAVTSLGRVPVKGVSDPLEVFEVTGVGPARTRLHAAARRGLTRFVGRDTELEQLWRAQELAGKGRGQVVAVVGEAGVGKSRLVYEFLHSHRLQGWLVLEATSVSYGKATSYLPVIDLLKRYFRVQDRDDLREIREKVTGKLLALDRALEPSLPALLSLLDVPVDDSGWHALIPAQRRQQTLDGVRRLILREAREQPLLVVFEDLHWMDGETQALLDSLVESLGSSRLLLLVNYRPEYQHTWAGKTYYSQSRLDALSPESTGGLLDALLGNDPGLIPLKQLLVKRGNPFFVEESVRTLVETKALAGERGRYRLAQSIGAIQVPSTVQTMLAARIDRLPSEEKRLLQVASVVGKDVPLRLLQHVADTPQEALQRALNNLQAAELVYEAHLYPDTEYSFKHALTHEVTYGSLLQERRRQLHVRVVQAIESLHADRLTEQVERLAHHAHRGALGEKAVHYLRQAADKAAARSALEEARSCFEQALAVLAGLPQTEATLVQAADIALELGPVLTQLGDVRTLLERLREAERLVGPLQSGRHACQLVTLMADTHIRLGDRQEALMMAGRAVELGQRLGDHTLSAKARNVLARAYYFGGDFRRSAELAAENLAGLSVGAIDETQAVPLQVQDGYVLLQSLGALGRFAEAAPHRADLIAFVDAIDHPYAICVAYHAAANLSLAQGELLEARSSYRRVIRVADTAGILIMRAATVHAMAFVLAQLGETAEAFALVREGEELLERAVAKGLLFDLVVGFRNLSYACLLLGQVADAKRFADRAVEFSSVRPEYYPWVLQVLGNLASHPASFDFNLAERHYYEAIALSEPQGRRPLIAHCRFRLGRLYAVRGQRKEAQTQLDIAATMFREMDMSFWLKQAESAMKELN
jgi:class 3 adenylate cyclase/tetratricopeptide (TPR) repeat protein